MRLIFLFLMGVLITHLSGCSYLVYDFSVYSLSFTPQITGATVGKPGDQVERVIGLKGVFNGGTVTYAPPWGAMDLQIEGTQPDAGGPPFVFHVSSAGEIATIRYTLPPLRLGQSQTQVFDILTAENAAGDFNAAFLATTLNHTGVAVAAAQDSAQGQAVAASRRYDIRQYQEDSTLQFSASMCSRWLSDIQSGMTFKAVLVPLAPVVDGESADAGIGFPGSEPPTWSLLDLSTQPETIVMSAPAVYDAALSSRLNDSLPHAANQTWVVWALPPNQTLTCPGDLNLAAGSWTMLSRYSVSIVGDPQPLESYTCYQGDNPPAYSSFTAQAAMTVAYHQDGITCLGPEQIELARPADFEVTTGYAQVFTPPGNVYFGHFVNPLSGPVEIDLTFDSDLALNWGFYNGNNAETRPVFASPIVSPLTVSKYKSIWIAAQVPAGTPTGPYRVSVTFTSTVDPSQTFTVTDLLWVGEWTAPGVSDPPGAPILLSPVNGGFALPGPVTLHWMPGDGTAPLQYELQVDGTSLTTTNTSQTVNLAQGIHTWAVRAWNDGGASPWAEFTVGVGTQYVRLPMIWTH